MEWTQAPASSSTFCCGCCGRVWDEGLHQRIVVLIVVEGVGCVAYPVRTWTDVLLGSATVVYASIVGPEVTPARVAVVPDVLGRVCVLCLEIIVEEVVVEHLNVRCVVENEPLGVRLESVASDCCV